MSGDTEWEELVSKHPKVTFHTWDIDKIEKMTPKIRFSECSRCGIGRHNVEVSRPFMANCLLGDGIGYIDD